MIYVLGYTGLAGEYMRPLSSEEPYIDAMRSMSSGTVSVINGSSDKVAADVKFNVNPANSGKIICNKAEYPTNIYLYVDAGTYCTAQPNNGFPFNTGGYEPVNI